VHALPPGLRHDFLLAFGHALRPVFLVGVAAEQAIAGRDGWDGSVPAPAAALGLRSCFAR